MNVAEGSDESGVRATGFDFPMQGAPWSQITPQYMPWGHTPACPAAPLVTFTAEAAPGGQEQPSTSHPFDPRATGSRVSPAASGMFYKHSLPAHCKRKAELDISVTSAKQHVTEERMAAHMSRLHISSESSPPPVTESSQHREQRLYVCEEMRRLQTESILPSALLGRLERPCMAVMLWQPPPRVPQLLPRNARNTAPRPLCRDVDNNNSSQVDLNNMDMDT